MAPHDQTIDDVYKQYAELLLRHHYLLSEDKDEAPETEAIEEEMTTLWDQLNPVQRKSLSGLGSDLSWIRRKYQPAPKGRRPEDVTEQDFESLLQARATGDWHEVLHYLRLCAPKTPPSQTAYARAMAWSELGLPKLARVFYDVATSLERPEQNGEPRS
jgi:hypothetical protein